MRKFLIVSFFAIFTVNLFGQKNDFFPLSQGAFFIYKFSRVVEESAGILRYKTTNDSGKIKFEVISVAENDSSYNWRIIEKRDIRRKITSYWESPRDSISYENTSEEYKLTEKKDELHTIDFNSRSGIWDSPVCWSSEWDGTVVGIPYSRFRQQDTLFNDEQCGKSVITYTTLKREFHQGKGITKYYYLINKGPNTLYSDKIKAELENETIVETKEEKSSITKIENFNLEQNYPNPFNPLTTIKYTVPKNSEVRLSVTDILGREVALLVNEKQYAGSHSVGFNAESLASGIYLYTLSCGQTHLTKKMAFVK